MTCIIAISIGVSAVKGSIPVTASGGAGKKEDFLELFKAGVADAGLAASVFHFKEINIKDLKEYLKTNNIEMRV